MINNNNNKMRVRTVRQVKQQRPKTRSVFSNNIANASIQQTLKRLSPPYRMPPQPQNHSETSIPGAAATDIAPIPFVEVASTAGTRLTNSNTASHQTHSPDYPNSLGPSLVDSGQQQISVVPSGAIPRTPARLPEDVTALAERDMSYKEKDGHKNAVSKTYHTLKDLISAKFKKDQNENADELNNVSVQQQQNQILTTKIGIDEFSQHYSALPFHMRQGLNQSQPNIWDGKFSIEQSSQILSPHIFNETIRGIQQQRGNSHPQLNMPICGYTGQQKLLDQSDRPESMANVDVTDSDEGGFATRRVHRPPIIYQMSHNNPSQHQMHSCESINSTKSFPSAYQHSHNNRGQHNGNGVSRLNQDNQNHSVKAIHTDNPPDAKYPFQLQSGGGLRQNVSIESQKHLQNELNQTQQNVNLPEMPHSNHLLKVIQQTDDIRTNRLSVDKTSPGLTGSTNDKNGNHHLNVHSGSGSKLYLNNQKSQVDKEHSGGKNDDSEWVDIVEAELRHILEPGIQELSLRPDSIVSGSVSSISPALPPLSPDSSYKPVKEKNSTKQEYGKDSYNRPGRNSGPIGPSRAGWPGSSIQKINNTRSSGKKHEQTLLKRHLFGLDNDMISTTTRSLDLDSLLGGQWGTGQSVSDSETDTHGIRYIRSQLEGLEHMYGEVLKILGSRSPNRLHDSSLHNGGPKRQHGSLSSLPSSSFSGRPIRDRRRNDDKRKVRDIKSINKRFQRLEAHVVTLARSVAHLSSEMRSQHLVTQELDYLRDEVAALRLQTNRSQQIYRLSEPEPPNLTNPRRVKKLTKFFGDDPPLLRLFLKNLGYEKYANLFETERIGMIELPYLGEERLQKLGVPLGPRLRILQEAQISLCKDKTLCIV